MKRIATSTLALLLGGAIVLYYLVMRKKASDAQAALVATRVIAEQKAAALAVSKPLPQPTSIISAQSPGLITASVNAGSQALAGATGVPGANIVIQALANTELNAVDQIIHGGADIGNVATVVFFPVAVSVAAANLIAKALGFSFGAAPLGPVRYTLIARQKDPPSSNGLGDGNIYVLDDVGTLHYLPWVNEAGFSWREVIAVRPALFDSLTVGYPVTKKSDPGDPKIHGFTPLGRPPDPIAIRAVFGNDAQFHISTETRVYGPWDIGLDSYGNPLPPPPPPPDPIDYSGQAFIGYEQSVGG